jgi:tRNA(Ile)-lysidine synthase
MAYAEAHKLSVQEAARDIRYNWLRELLLTLDEEGKAGALKGSHGYRGYRLLTAHHLDDNIETVLMNFFKGTGISGIRGMLPATDAVARPLLFARKAELEDFARGMGLDWVEDSSNREAKYSRNFLRLNIIPEIEKLYPRLSDSIAAQISRFRALEQFVDAAVAGKLQKWLVEKDGEVYAPVNRLKQEPGVETLLFSLIIPYGFSPAQVEEVKHLLEADTGRQVASATHRIFRNRAWLVIAPVAIDRPQMTLIESLPVTVRVGNGFIDIDAIMGPPSPEALKTPDIHYLDAGDITLPLLARPWKKGDYFYPLGMRKKKKLARFFIDAKLSQTEKEKQWVLESGQRILLIAGQRIDDRFKIQSNSRQVLRVRFRPGG